MRAPRRSGYKGRGGSSLSAQLDREVLAAAQAFTSNIDTRADITFSAIYQYIKKSNSSLARKPKTLIEDSIERIIATLREDLGSDEETSSSGSEHSHVKATTFDMPSANAMNRRMVQSWHSGNENSDNASPAIVARSETLPSDNSKKRSPSSHNAGPTGSANGPNQPRSSKRPRVDDTLPLSPPKHLSFADLGGMHGTIDLLQEVVLLPLYQPSLYVNRGVKMPRGILLHGPPGCGKTMLCETIAAELQLPFLSISAPSIVSGMSGESEKALRGHFERAIEAAPCLMFIDEIDAITPKRESAQREMERRIVAQLLTCMDDLDLNKTGGKPVIVLAATNRPDSLDPALRRAGRFDTEINIGVPDVKMRARILEAQTRKTDLSDDVNFEDLSQKTPGFVGADLDSLVSRAGIISNRRYLRTLQELSTQHEPNGDYVMVNGNRAITEADAASHTSLHPSITRFYNVRNLLSTNPPALSCTITHADFLTALPSIQPSALREGFATVPTTSFRHVGALSTHRAALTSAIINPIKFPDRYARFGLNHPQGVLLYGPPGCGKTLLARAVARESGANFISVKGPELMNKYVGESERAVRTLFSRARHSQPVIVFFDELDALTPRRGAGEAVGETGGSALSEAASRVVNTLLTELDGSGRDARTPNSVHVIAASNRPESIDPAILRAGRLGKHLFVGLPSNSERVDIIQTLLRDIPVGEGQLDGMMAFAATACQGFSGADLEGLVREASIVCVERGGDALGMADLERAVERGVKASVGSAEVERWEGVRLG